MIALTSLPDMSVYPEFALNCLAHEFNAVKGLSLYFDCKLGELVHSKQAATDDAFHYFDLLRHLFANCVGLNNVATTISTVAIESTCSSNFVAALKNACSD